MILTIATSKGGSGKTTTAAALLQAAAARGYKALGVDLDPLDYAPRCTAAQDYDALLSAIMKEVTA